MNYFANLLAAQAHSLLLPRGHKADVERYVSTHQVTRAPRERAPFRRQLDFWAFSLATALAQGLPPIEGPPSKWGERFIDTQNVELGDDLSSLLAIVSISTLGHDDVDAGKPNRIIDLANRFVAVGCPVVLRALSSNTLRLRPLDRAIAFAKDLREETRSPRDRGHDRRTHRSG